MLSFSGDKSVVIVRACEGRAVFPRLGGVSEMWTSAVEVGGVCALPEVGDEVGLSLGGVTNGVSESECVW